MEKSLYRALPKIVKIPDETFIVEPSMFEKADKTKIQEAPSSTQHHKGTVIWHSKTEGYFLQIMFTDRPDIYAKSICTIQPKFGMDSFNGMLVQDVEEFILRKELGFNTKRLLIFGNEKEVDIVKYLKSRGVNASFADNKTNEDQTKPITKKWWEFWK